MYFFLLLLARRHKVRRIALRARIASPPMTPPAMAPALFLWAESLVWDGGGDEEVEVDEVAGEEELLEVEVPFSGESDGNIRFK
jgi:hypothetical protein